MRRRDIIALVGAAAFASPLAVRAKAAGRIPLVAISFGSRADDPFSKQRIDGFIGGMSQLGWAEGRNIRYELSFDESSMERSKANALKIVASAPDAVLVSGTLSTLAIHAATASVPVVFVNVADPVAGGLVASLARPGGNMTGFAPFEYGIAGKWLQLLHLLAPGINRAALFGDGFNPSFLGFWSAFEQAAASEKIEAVKIAANNAQTVEDAMRALAALGNCGLVISASQFSIAHRVLIQKLAVELKLPAIYWARFFAETGGLLSYGPDFVKMHRQSADYVDRILRGEKPANLPVQHSTEFETVFNAKTATALGLSVPNLFLATVDEVIE